MLQYIITAPEYDLHRDEYLHLDLARHPAWGYMSVPPFTFWISYLILALGNSVFWVKFFPALFGALTLVVVWKTIEILKGNLFALILGATAITFSILLRINMLYQPNSMDILSWTLVYYMLVRYMDSENSRWLYLTALVFALGFLNKYNVVFLIVGLVPALLITDQRRIFTDKHLYFASALALLIISPNIVWQYQNNFPIVHHMKELASTQLIHVNRVDFLREQLLFFTGSIFILVAAFISFFRYPAFKKFQTFFWAFLATMALFLYFKAKAYYAIGLYPIFLAFGAVYLERIFSFRRQWLRLASLVLILLSAIPLFILAFPIESPERISENSEKYKYLGLLRWEDGKDHALPQDFADMLGWKELAEKVDQTYKNIDDKAHTLVLCDNYGQAGAINYYSKYNLRAVTMNADYINWFPLDTEIQNVILVQNADDDDKERKKERPLFESVFLTGTIENPFARENGVRIYALLNAKVSINAILKEDIKNNRWD